MQTKVSVELQGYFEEMKKENRSIVEMLQEIKNKPDNLD
jgi:hypothetical protein